MDAGLRPVVDSVNAIRVPQDYMTSASRCVRQMVRWRTEPAAANAKMQADAAHAALKQADDLTGLRSGL